MQLKHGSGHFRENELRGRECGYKNETGRASRPIDVTLHVCSETICSKSSSSTSRFESVSPLNALRLKDFAELQNSGSLLDVIQACKALATLEKQF
jgi:hypothetical protein